MIVDNMLWSGRVLDASATDPDTEGVRELTRTVFADPEFASVLVPLRDGVVLAQRR